MLGPDHQKLSKRRGARNVLEYGELGYLPAAIVNAMALLGWSSGDEEEVFTLDQLCERFTLERVNPAPAIFDPKRLDDLNGIHIRRLDADALVDALEFHLTGTSKEVRRALVPLLRERMVTLADATRLCAPLLGEVVLDPSIEFPPKKVDQATAVAIIDATIDAVEHGGLDDPAALLERIRAVAEAAGSKPRDAFRVLYVAVLGSPTGLPVIEVDGVPRLGDLVAAAARSSRPPRLSSDRALRARARRPRSRPDAWWPSRGRSRPIGGIPKRDREARAGDARPPWPDGHDVAAPTVPALPGATAPRAREWPAVGAWAVQAQGVAPPFPSRGRARPARPALPPVGSATTRRDRRRSRARRWRR